MWTPQRKFVLVIVMLSSIILLLGSVTMVNLATQAYGVLPTANGGVPSGVIVFVGSGSCPTGFTEQAFAGDYILSTVAANSDVGTTGGSLTSGATSAGTPAGTNGTTTTGATSAGTPAGTVACTNVNGGTTSSVKACSSATVPTFTGSAMATHTHTVPAETFTGSAMATHTHTISPTYVKLIACQKN